MKNISDLKTVEIEVSSYCNLKCPLCSRYTLEGDLIAGLKQKYLEIEYVDKIAEGLSHLKDIHFDLSGVFGDPMTHPKIVLIVEKLLSENHHVSITTNGTLGTSEDWTALGNLSKTTKRLGLEFSIDGTKKTNSLYRKGANFDLICKNAQSYFQGGGHAIWKMILFKHNENDVEDCKNLSKELGFREFKVVHSTRWPSNEFTLKNIHQLYPSSYVIQKKIPLKYEASSLEGPTFIDCRSMKNGYIYIDSWGDIFPCCYFGGDRYLSRSWQDYWKDIESTFGEGFNSLVKASIQGFIEGDYYQYALSDSWSNPGCLLKSCKTHCSKVIKSENVLREQI